ncbi:FMN-dependent alpha-hydroxy acid dehydrogenase [Dothidotthia symphoricarpi CBS 119687]|uniref:FMN-dependent alpha-hydroxy acid dehydrogenase n=1 Tax=Dothidotthia symphoricarpi CBS 119687 TaxID=1392245 RepID=A0A6A6AGL2_9PLEO|nr:FMN-dependent alpha-hydroxy acid dehydrogenase [Dothidotthia symphoricarpi CBS 119687]KAF2130188.1 FMN-dependent alpha-hydroxy acid dehydrogenase [Dothidotthia symphoricarpi CBS 119687]
MRFSLLAFATVALAARPFLEEPDTGIDDALGNTPDGTLPPLESMVGLPDFQWAARRYMNTSAFTYYRNGAAGEWSYRNNLEVFQRFPLRPRVLRDITNVEASLPTTILGYNTSAPFFISPCARGGYAHPDGELGLAKGASSGQILYMASLFSSKPMADIYAAGSNRTAPFFQQVYLTDDMNATQQLFKQIEDVGSKAIVLTIDSPGDGIRHRAARYSVGSADSSLSLLTWDLFHKYGNMTKLPIIPKGIQTVEDAREAVNNGAKAIFLSNHGGRQIDQSPSSLEVALEIYNKDPDVFSQTEVYADGGVRYGTDILKLLSLGVKAVGVGRPFMYANVYGAEGVEKVIDILKYELLNDAANLGVADLKKIGPQYVNWAATNVWSQ